MQPLQPHLVLVLALQFLQPPVVLQLQILQLLVVLQLQVVQLLIVLLLALMQQFGMIPQNFRPMTLETVDLLLQLHLSGWQLWLNPPFPFTFFLILP